jgi:GH24 family phage-related lysozyme (muramidase)
MDTDLHNNFFKNIANIMASSQTIQMIIEEEGNIPHLYKDTKGKITIGVGYVVRNLDAALKLDFIDKASGARASQEDIRKEYEAIAILPFGQGYPAVSYTKYTRLVLSSTEINRLLNIMAAEKEKEVALRLPLYEYPEDVQRVLIDMAYNLGTTGLFNKFPKFIEAIKAKKWSEASKECRSRDISEERNQKRKSLLERASK